MVGTCSPDTACRWLPSFYWQLGKSSTKEISSLCLTLPRHPFLRERTDACFLCSLPFQVGRGAELKNMLLGSEVSSSDEEITETSLLWALGVCLIYILSLGVLASGNWEVHMESYGLWGWTTQLENFSLGVWGECGPVSVLRAVTEEKQRDRICWFARKDHKISLNISKEWSSSGYRRSWHQP